MQTLPTRRLATAIRRLLVALALAALVPAAAEGACGNGVLEGKEQCDLGAENNRPSSCCKKNCQFRGAAFGCRPAAGGCDVAETCTGRGGLCPADALAAPGAVCRPPAGPCDAAEECTGTANTCPANAFQPAGLFCRPAAGVCDGAETCTGSSAACPADLAGADGTPCSDGDACTIDDVCLGGVCAPGTSTDCGTATLTFAPIADAYVDATLPATNFNGDERLRADASPERVSYLRFAVSGTAGRPVLRARLRLEASAGSATSGGSVHLITPDGWDESTLTYDSRPPLDGPTLATIGPIATGTVAEFVLDGAITGDGGYDVALDTPTSDGVAYRSMAATSGRRPALVLTLGGGGNPDVGIAQPADGATFLAGEPITLQGNAVDDVDGDLSAHLVWTSNLDGSLGSGAVIVAAGLSFGEHTVTAAATDSTGATGSAAVVIRVASFAATQVFAPVADTYVTDDLPLTSFGGVSELKVDDSPVRQTFLRFQVSGLRAPVREAHLRLTVSPSASAASDAGGSVHGLSDNTWSEAGTTFATRPTINGPPLAGRGAVVPGAVVDFEVSGAISRGDGIYSFAVVGASSDGTAYQSREAAAGRPALIVSQESPDYPVVIIETPPSGTTVASGQAILFRATATDPQDGDLAAALAWASSLDGPIGSGATFSRVLRPGTHVVSATALDGDSNHGAATVVVVVRSPDTGFEDFGYGAGVETSDNRATAEKPESKLWSHDGRWWATLWSPLGHAHRIHHLDPTTQTWSDTGVQVDERPHSRQDALSDAGQLYVVSRFGGTPPQNRFLRYSYRPVSHSYALDAEFPVPLPGGGAESVTVDRDSTGRLWIAYTLDARVFVSHTLGSDAQWAAPFVVPVADGTMVSADDIAAVVALPEEIGVLWSNQLTGTFYFAVHADGLSPSDPRAWRLETAASGAGMADDHMNLKVASDGRLFAAVKTSLTGPGATLIGLLIRLPTASWSPLHQVVATDYEPTRPQCLVDEAAHRVYVVYSVHGDAIHYKASDLSTIAFAGGAGTPLMASGVTGGISNPTTTKQRVVASGGRLVAASTPVTQRYWHASVP